MRPAEAVATATLGGFCLAFALGALLMFGLSLVAVWVFMDYIFHSWQR